MIGFEVGIGDHDALKVEASVGEIYHSVEFALIQLRRRAAEDLT